MDAGQQPASVVVRLTFLPADLSTGLDDLRDMLQREDALRRKVSLVLEPDGRPTLGVHEVLDVVLEAAASNAASNVAGGILGGVVESVLGLWLYERLQRRRSRDADPGYVDPRYVGPDGVVPTTGEPGPEPDAPDGSAPTAIGVDVVRLADGRSMVVLRLGDDRAVNAALLRSAADLTDVLLGAPRPAPDRTAE